MPNNNKNHKESAASTFFHTLCCAIIFPPAENSLPHKHTHWWASIFARGAQRNSL